MKFIALALSALPVVFSAGGSFSYQPDSDKGPLSWGSLDLGPYTVNECGGSAQSGIDVPTSSCDVFDDYIFSVSKLLPICSIVRQLRYTRSMSGEKITALGCCCRSPKRCRRTVYCRNFLRERSTKAISHQQSLFLFTSSGRFLYS